MRHAWGRAVGLAAAAVLVLSAGCGTDPARRPEPPIPQAGAEAPAPARAPTGRAEGAPTRRGQTFLWQIASPTASVHLLGSIHLASRDLYPLDPRIEGAFQRSSALVIETPLDSAAQQEAARKFAQAGIYPGDDAMELHVSRELLTLLQQRLARMGVPFSSVRAMRPWLLATVLILREMQRLGYEPAYGIDRYFADRAEGRKTIRTLEALDEQIAVFAGMPEPVQEQMLRETLTKLDLLETHMATALRLWKTGDAAGLDAALVAPTRTAYPDLFRRMFADRNRKMTDAVDGYLRSSGRYFVVVGAGHLVGPGGMLDLLRARGYLPVQQ
jgi:uncharacterized protein YbaP (TraB family)